MNDDRRPRLSRRGFLATGLATGLGAATLGRLVSGCGDEAARGDDADLDATDTRADADAGATDVAADSDLAVDSDVGDDADALADGGVDADDATEVAEEVAPPPRFDPDTYAEASESIFPIGVGASDPVAGGVILATRYVGADPLELVVWRRDGDGPDGVLVARVAVTPAEAGFVQHAVEGLVGGAVHGYTFVAGQRRSPLGAFRAAPGAGEKPVVRLGASSCARWDFRPFSVLERAAEDTLDLFLLLGDTTYADDCETLAAYRDNWGRNLGAPEYRALRASTTCAATWDDHEVANNWDPETIDPARLAMARQAFFEHMALRRDPTAPERIWRSVRWGDTLEVFLLDCRGERKPSTRDSDAAEYVSEAQLAWLAAGLAASTAVFKVVVSSVPITRWPLLYLGANERWEGYAAQRERALEAAAGVSGLLWLAGDFHFGAVTRVDPPGGDFAAQQEVLVGPIAHLNPAVAIVEATGSREQFPFLTGDRNYGRLTFDPTTTPPRLTIDHVATDGHVLGTFVIEA